MEALLHVQGVDVDIGADLAQESLLQLVEKPVADDLLTIRQTFLSRGIGCELSQIDFFLVVFAGLGLLEQSGFAGDLIQIEV